MRLFDPCVEAKREAFFDHRVRRMGRKGGGGVCRREGDMPKAMIIYATRTGNTQIVAEAIRNEMEQSGVAVLLKRVANVEISELAGVDAVILGAPTYHHDLIESMKTFLFKMESVDLRGKIGAAFGTYGWSGESVEMMNDTMKHVFGMEIIAPGFKLVGRPTGESLEQCRKFGREIVTKIKEVKPDYQKT
jgi:flavodoxin short chain